MTISSDITASYAAAITGGLEKVRDGESYDDSIIAYNTETKTFRYYNSATIPLDDEDVVAIANFACNWDGFLPDGDINEVDLDQVGKQCATAFIEETLRNI